MDELVEHSGSLGSKFNNFEHKPKKDIWNDIYKNIDIHKPTGILNSVFSDFNYYPHQRVWAAISSVIHPERKRLLVRRTLSIAAGLVILISSTVLVKNRQWNKSMQDGNKQATNLIYKKSSSTINDLNKSNGNVFIDSKKDSLKSDNFLFTDNDIKIKKVNIIDLINVEKRDVEPELDKIAPLGYKLNETNWKDIVLTKIPFLNLYFKEDESSKSIGLNGMLATNLTTVLRKSDALASSTFDYASGVINEVNNSLESDYSKEKQYDNITNYPPFTMGFVFNYNFTKRFSVSTGINYTRLSSFAYSEGSDWRSEYKSSKHYLGIPVNINFNIIQQKKYTFFLFSGIQFDEGLLDKNKTTDYKNSEVLNEYMSTSKFIGGQASYNFGFGTTYYLSKNFDLYLQTNLSHYFYQSHYNVWTDHKYWPGIQIGFRYNLQ